MPKDNNPVFPMQTIGDEATAISTSWMFLMWTSQLSPYLTDAAASRMLIAIIPAERYVIHPESQINLTIQAACKCITESFNRLSEVGIPLRDPTDNSVVTRTNLAILSSITTIDYRPKFKKVS